jgi:alpha-galactosidase
VICSYLGEENRKDALRGASFVVNAIQVGGYDPCTVIDFEIPKKYGLRQTIADTLGIGGIMRALRTIPVMEEFARDMEEVCPEAWLLNYTNPMAMLTGYMLRYTKIKTVGLCHSVQVCSETLLNKLDMADRLEGRKELIAGINHMGWLLQIRDRDGNDLYPEIRRRAREMNEQKQHDDMVRFDYIGNFGYYCTESSEHNAEYNPFYIKAKAPELIERFNIPLDEYPRRCIHQIDEWNSLSRRLLQDADLTHSRTREYASYIMEAIYTDSPIRIGGNVLNTGHLISDFPEQACVEVPCLVDGAGIHPTHVGALPPVLAAMNMTNINPQLLTIHAARTRKREDIYRAAMLEPRCAAELTVDEIRAMVDEMIEAHGSYMQMYD